MYLSKNLAAWCLLPPSAFSILPICNSHILIMTTTKLKIIKTQVAQGEDYQITVEDFKTLNTLATLGDSLTNLNGRKFSAK